MKENIIRLLKEKKKIDHTAMTLKKFIGEKAVITAFYAESHKNNIKKVLEFITGRQISAIS